MVGLATKTWASIRTRALPGFTSIAPKLTAPILILQSESNGNIPKAEAEELLKVLSANGDATLKMYPGLGHSLGVASRGAEDAFRPIDEKPLLDTVDWLDKHTCQLPTHEK